MFAIRNKDTKKWVYGTDYRYGPPKQRTSNEQALTYETYEEADNDIHRRGVGSKYEAVEVILVDVTNPVKARIEIDLQLAGQYEEDQEPE